MATQRLPQTRLIASDGNLLIAEREDDPVVPLPERV